MSSELTVQDIINWLKKLEGLTSEGAKVLHVKHLLLRAYQARVEKDFIKDMNCQLFCSDGSGKPVTEHQLGCSKYSSGHSIDVNGNCNKGCC